MQGREINPVVLTQGFVAIEAIFNPHRFQCCKFTRGHTESGRRIAVGEANEQTYANDKFVNLHFTC